MLLTLAACAAATLGGGVAHAADLIPCGGTEIDLAAVASGKTRRDAKVWLRNPGGGLDTMSMGFDPDMLGDGFGDIFDEEVSLTADVDGEIHFSNSESWLWVDAFGDVDLTDSGSWLACSDPDRDRFSVSWIDVAERGDGSRTNTFQMVMTPSPECEEGVQIELRMKKVEWAVLIEAGSPAGVESHGKHRFHARRSNVRQAGVYRFQSCAAPATGDE